MLVLVIGSYEPLRVSRHRRTSQYTSEDYYKVRRIVECFPVRVTTPHILTEVSNHLGQSEKGSVKNAYFQAFSQVIAVFEEVHVAARQISARPHFAEYGITDLGILAAAEPRLQVWKADSRLADYLSRVAVEVVDYNHFIQDN